MNNKQMQYLMRRPEKFMKHRMTGWVPKENTIRSPLITALEAITPRDRYRLVGMRINQKLGYGGDRQFANAEQALRWLKPSRTYIENNAPPSESWRDKRFAKPLSISEIFEQCRSVPEDIKKRYL